MQINNFWHYTWNIFCREKISLSGTPISLPKIADLSIWAQEKITCIPHTLSPPLGHWSCCYHGIVNTYGSKKASKLTETYALGEDTRKSSPSEDSESTERNNSWLLEDFLLVCLPLTKASSCRRFFIFLDGLKSTFTLVVGSICTIGNNVRYFNARSDLKS